MTGERCADDPGVDQYRLLFDVIDEGFCLCEMLLDEDGSPVDYRFLDVNPLFEEMTGLRDPVGRTVMELVPDLEPRWIETYARVAIERQQVRFEERSDAMGRWFDVFAAPMGEHRHFAVVFKDISAVRLAELELKASEARFRAMADQLPVMVWVHGADGGQQFVNDTFCRYFGVERGAMTRDEWQVLTHPDDASAYVDAFVTAVETRGEFRADVRAQRGDGTWRWVESWGVPRFDADGAFLGHIGVSRDIQDRKEAEARLAEAAAFTDRVLDNLFTFAGVLTTDGTVISANTAPLEAAGIGLADVVGRKFWDCFWWSYSKTVADRLRAAVADAATGRVERYDVDVRILDGDLLPIDFQVAPLRNDEGEITHLVVSGMDLTERRAAEAEREVRLRSERHARQRSETLERTAVALAGAETVDDVANALVRSLSEMPSVSTSVVVERDGELVSIASSGGPGLMKEEMTTPHVDDDRPIAVVFRTGVALEFDGAAAFDARYPHLSEARDAAQIESLAVVPVVRSGRAVLGVLTVSSSSPRWFDDDRRSLLKAVAVQASGALDRAMLHEEARRSRARAELVANVLTEIESEPTVDQQLLRLAEVLVPRVADFVTIESPMKDDPIRALVHVDSERAITLAALRRQHQLDPTGTTSTERDAAGELELLPRVSPAMLGQYATDQTTVRLLEHLGTRSSLLVPLDLGEGEPGVLMCGLSDPTRRVYRIEDLDFIADIARRAGAVIQATRARQQEHEFSLRLQQALLPDRLAEHPLIDISARYQAASDRLEVGGDWYDTFVWPSGHYAVVVGDVVGHGIESAASMGGLRAASAALIADADPDPSQMLGIIARQSREQRSVEFLTAFCAVFDPNEHRVRYASAGHPPALLARADGTVRWLDDARSPAITAHLQYESRRTGSADIGPDDVLVAYSDGLIERRGRTLDDGLAWLQAAAPTMALRDVDQISDDLFSRMAAGGDDDVIIVAARYRATQPRLRVRVPADLEQLAPLRHQLQHWLIEQNVRREKREAILLGVGEACSNAIEHSYTAGRAGHVQLRAAFDPDEARLIVTVSDGGIWRAQAAHPVNRGRGTGIMSAVADRFDRATGLAGTTTTLEFDLR